MKPEQSSLRTGMIVRKKSFGFFGKDEGLAMKVRKIKPCKNPALLFVNGIAINPDDLIVISEEEEKSLWEEFRTLGISKADPRNLPSQCTRDDNGQKKNAYDTPSRAIHVLWQMRKKYPDKHFEAYECPHCQKFHVGKPTDSPLSDVLSKIVDPKPSKWLENAKARRDKRREAKVGWFQRILSILGIKRLREF